MILLTLKIYPDSTTIFLMVMIFRYSSFGVNPITVFKSDVIMMIYVIRVKPFDVPFFINRIDSMTSTALNT